MTNTTFIREITKSDHRSLLALFQEFTVFENKPDFLKNTLERMDRESDFIQGFVVENEAGVLVGYATWYIAYHTWTGKAIHLDDLYLKENYRGGGLGRTLIQKVIDLGREKGCYKVKWRVSAWNEAAQSFYRKLGAEISDSEYNCDLILE